MKKKANATHHAALTFLRALAGNIANGVRVTFFRTVAARSWATTPAQLFAMTVVVLCADAALVRTFFSSATFSWGGLRSIGLDVAIYMMVGWLVVRAAPKRIPALLMPVALFCVVLAIGVISTGTYHVTRLLPKVAAAWAWYVLYYGFCVWMVIVAVTLARRAANIGTGRALMAVSPFVLAIAYSVLVPGPRFWYANVDAEADTAAATPRASVVTEEVLYFQPRLVDDTLNALLPGRRGVTDLYTVGFAPYSYQDVFMKESESFLALMDDRFDALGRSMLLVNNNKTLHQFPLATVTNLRAALMRIGQKMNRDEDVLVLYLTSHGSREHALSADYWPLELNELDPATLKTMLDEARITWRVVIVSACYSGGYIEPLRGPTTLVMTASDATHTSFGCDAEADFTYFARALIDEQLRTTHSFEDAFTRAVPVIREREKGKQDEFSNPQIAMGERMRAKLRDVEQRLGKLGSTDSDAQLRDRLVGDWLEKGSAAGYDFDYNISLRRNGEFELTGVERRTGEKKSDRFVWRGRWGVDRRMFWYEITYTDPVGHTPLGERQEDRIMSVSRTDWLMVEQYDGEASRARRVK